MIPHILNWFVIGSVAKLLGGLASLPWALVIILAIAIGAADFSIRKYLASREKKP